MKTPEQQVADLTSVLEVTEQMHQKAQAEHRAVKAERDRLQAVVDELVDNFYLYSEVEETVSGDTLREIISIGINYEYVNKEDAPTAYAYLREREGKDA